MHIRFEQTRDIMAAVSLILKEKRLSPPYVLTAFSLILKEKRLSPPYVLTAFSLILKEKRLSPPYVLTALHKRHNIVFLNLIQKFSEQFSLERVLCRVIKCRMLTVVRYSMFTCQKCYLIFSWYAIQSICDTVIKLLPIKL